MAGFRRLPGAYVFRAAIPRLQVFGAQAAVFGDASQHARPNLVAIVESEDQVGPAGTGQDAMGARLALDDPAYPQQCGQNRLGVGAGPVGHAALKEMSSISRPASSCSRRSATTRSASAWTRAIASS